MKYKDYYETLGVARTATQDEIKSAFRKLARKFHPDVSKATDAEARFKEINEANEVLKDPEKRAAYDQMGSGLKNGQEFQPPPNWDEGFEFRGAEGADIGDLFESLFGRRSRGSASRQRASAAGEDHHAKVLIDLEDSYRGAERSITLRVPAEGSDGRVALQERTLDVHIPKGIRAGQHLRLAGQGAAGFGGGRAGDLYLEIEFKAHPRFRVDGADIYVDLPLAPWEAALGATVDAATPEGTVQLTIPPESLAGRKLRLKGRGLPGKKPGDLYAVLSIALPKADADKSRAVYEEMAKAFPDFNPRVHLQG
ncbi:MAG: DnaJ C-terminal domain-containing protein [Caldimonas sp.]